MVRVIEGDLFHHKWDAVIVPTNTVGAMGRGLALSIKKRYPKVYHTYRHACNAGEHRLGEPLVILHDNKTFVCCATKEDWRNAASIETISAALKAFHKFCSTAEGLTIALPLLGGGNGNIKLAKGLCYEEVLRRGELVDAHRAFIASVQKRHNILFFK